MSSGSPSRGKRFLWSAYRLKSASPIRDPVIRQAAPLEQYLYCLGDCGRLALPASVLSCVHDCVSAPGMTWHSTALRCTPITQRHQNELWRCSGGSDLHFGLALSSCKAISECGVITASKLAEV